MEPVEAETLPVALPETVKPITAINHISMNLVVNGAPVQVPVELNLRMQPADFKPEEGHKVIGLFMDANGKIIELEAIEKVDEVTGETYWEIPYVGDGNYLLFQAEVTE